MDFWKAQEIQGKRENTKIFTGFKKKIKMESVSLEWKIFKAMGFSAALCFLLCYWTPGARVMLTLLPSLKHRGDRDPTAATTDAEAEMRGCFDDWIWLN